MLDGSAAISRMAPGTKNTASACLYTVWVALGCPHTLGRLAGHTFATATEAYQYTTKRHTDRNPPAGVPVWFGSTAGPRYAGDTHWPDGDVALSVGNGFLYGTDYPVFGHTGKCTIAQREQQTGRVYLGWTEDFLGNDVAYAGAASTDATPLISEEDDMKLTAIRNHDGSLGIIDSAGLLHSISDQGLWNVYLRLGIVEKQADGQFWLQQTDGTVWNALTARTVAAGQALTEVHATVTRPVLRDGKPVSQIQDNADTGTLARQIVSTTGAVQSAITAKIVSGVDPAAVEAAVTKALAGLTLKATS